jgi:hypothetical protein
MGTAGTKPRETSGESLVRGCLVMSGRAARCNKPSAKVGGIHLQQEVTPQPSGKISSRLPPALIFAPESRRASENGSYKAAVHRTAKNSDGKRRVPGECL